MRYIFSLPRVVYKDFLMHQLSSKTKSGSLGIGEVGLMANLEVGLKDLRLWRPNGRASDTSLNSKDGKKGSEGLLGKGVLRGVMQKIES